MKADSSDPFEQAKNLLVKFKHAKLYQAFEAWKALSEFEGSVSAAQEALGPYEDILSIAPTQRSSKEISKLCELLSKVTVYSSLPQPVKAFIAAHCRLLVIWDTQELPRTPDEAANLYSIVSGGIKCVVAEPSDVVLRCMVRQAADQLLEVDGATGDAATTLPDTSSSSPFKIIQNSTSPVPDGAAESAPQPQQKPRDSDTPSKAVTGSRGHTSERKRRGVRRSDTMRTYGLSAKYAVPSVQARLWHTVIQMIHAGRVPSKREAELLLEQANGQGTARSQATSNVRGHHVSLQSVRSPRASFAGGFDSDPAPSRRVSMAGGVDRPAPRMSMSGMTDPRLRMSMSGAGDGPRPRMSTMGGTTMSRRASMAGGLLGGGAAGGVALIELQCGESFSGRELDCRAESGQAESLGEFPPKVLAAVTTPNTMTSLLVISKPVYRLAMRMTSEALVQQAVSACCRFPFLRHTPLKEIYRLAHHMQQSVFPKGEVLLQQGKECGNLYMMLEGEVDIVVDVPLLAPGLSKDQLKESLGSMGPASPRLPAKDTCSGGSVVTGGPQTQRVLLARRGPGYVLGDDALRDKVLTVSAIVSSGTATCLWTSQSRFTMCVDPLTLRLFQRLRAQQGAWLELCTASADAATRAMLLQRCRDQVLGQVLPKPAVSVRGEPLPDVPRWTPPDVAGQFFSTPLSLNAGIRAMLSIEESSKKAFGPTKVDWSTVVQETSQQVDRRRQGKDGKEPDDLPELPQGISTSWLAGIGVTESISKLHKMIARVEQERAAQRAQDAAQSNQGTGGAGGQVQVLDLREQLVQLATNRQVTDHLEAACVAILKVTCLPGQLDTDGTELAPVLDDAMVEWSALAHNAQVILVRWSSDQYLVLATIEPCAQRRPAVRQVSDVVLGIFSSFNRLVATNPISHLVLHVGVAIGSTFITQDTGRCVTSVSGVAYDAAHHLCGSAQDELPEGGILVSDAVMQAISRTHVLSFSAQGYQLLRACTLPFGTTHEQLLTQKVLDVEPVAPGSGQAARYRSQLDHLVLSTDKPAGEPPPLGGSLEVQLSVHFSGTEGIATLEDASRMHIKASSTSSQLKDGGRSGGGGLHGSSPSLTHKEQQQQQYEQLVTRSVVAVQGAVSNHHAQSPGSKPVSRRRYQGQSRDDHQDHVQSLTSQQEATSTQPSLIMSQSCELITSEASSASVRAGRTKTAAHREALRSMTKMQVRQQLRSELRQLGRSWPEPGDLSRIPHSTFRPTIKLPPPLQAETPSQAAATALHQAGLVHTGCMSPPRSTSPVRHGFRSHASFELTAPISPNATRTGASPKPSIMPGITPYSPGTGPLANLTARHRTAEVLFAGAGSIVHTAQSAVLPHSASSTPSSRTPERASTPDLSTRGVSMAGVDAVAVALQAVASRPDSASGRVIPVVQQPAIAAAVASVAVSGMPLAPSRRQPTSVPLVLASPSLRPVSGGKRPGSQERGSRPTTPSTHIASNHGLVAVEQLMHQQGHVATQANGTGPRFDEKAQQQASKRQVDKVTGMSMSTIHKQAVAAWKDMGSLHAAEAYVHQLPAGVLNVSFSTAGLPNLPSLSRLDHIESLAASFNTVPGLTSKWLSGLCQHLNVLSLSNNPLARLPSDFGHHLPSVTELNMSCCQLEEIPDSLSALPRLRRLSLEHNKLKQLPPSLWRLDGLEQLYLGHNALTSLPDWWGSFPVLQVLHLQSNNLEEVPDSLVKLGGSLISLNLSHNSLSSLPHAFLTAFTCLERLHLQYNRLCGCRQIHGLMADTCHFDLESAFSFTERPDTAASHNSRAAELATARTKSFAQASLAAQSTQGLALGQPTRSRTPPDQAEGHSPSAKASRPYSGQTHTSGKQGGGDDHDGLVSLKSPSRGVMVRPTAADLGLPEIDLGDEEDPGKTSDAREGKPRKSASQVKHAVIFEPLEAELSVANAFQGESRLGADAAQPAGVVAASLGSLWDQLRQSKFDEDNHSNSITQQPALPVLRYLNLGGNQLRELPAWLPPSLTYLDLTKNSIAHVPTWLFDKLTHLECLALSNNQLQDMPRQITGLTSLRMLTLEHNPMTDPEAKDGGMEAAAWAWEAIRSTKYQCKKESTLGGGAGVTQTLPDAGQQEAAGVPETPGKQVGTPSVPNTARAGLIGASRPSTSAGLPAATAGLIGASRPSTSAGLPATAAADSGATGGGAAAPVTVDLAAALARQAAGSRPGTSTSQHSTPTKSRPAADAATATPAAATVAPSPGRLAKTVGRSPLSRVTGGGAPEAQGSAVSLAAGVA